MATFDHNRTYGIEIEMSWGRTNAKPAASTVANALIRAGIQATAPGYTHEISDGWKVVSDASVSNGWELVSPILSGLNGKEQLKTAMRTVKSLGAVTHGSCGVHVHHGVHDFTAKQLANIAQIYANNEDVIDQLVAPSRRGNCRWAATMKRGNNFLSGMVEADEQGRDIDMEVPYYDFASQLTASALPSVPWVSHRGQCPCNDCENKSRLVGRLAPGGRYYKVNYHSYIRQGTVEFRQHQSSLNAIKIWDWVVFTQMVVTTAKGKRGKAKPRVINQGNVETRPERALIRDLGMHKRVYRSGTDWFLDRPGTENYDDITMASMRRLVRRRNGIGFSHTVRFQNGVDITEDDDQDVVTMASTDRHALTCDGNLVERMNRSTRERFMGCSNYRRGCRFTTQIITGVHAGEDVPMGMVDDMDLDEDEE